MANLNKVFLIGNLTRDPELRYTPSGAAVTEFGLAVSRQFTDSSGERRENTCFVDIQMWGRQAEVANEYLRKGRPLFVEGRLDYSTWEGQDGQKRSKLRVVAENFQFLGSREGGDRGGSGFRDRGRYDDEPTGAPVESPSPPRRSREPGEPESSEEDFNLGEVPF
jgi:single-strand DNA-binding protein